MSLNTSSFFFVSAFPPRPSPRILDDTSSVGAMTYEAPPCSTIVVVVGVVPVIPCFGTDLDPTQNSKLPADSGRSTTWPDSSRLEPYFVKESAKLQVKILVFRSKLGTAPTVLATTAHMLR